MARTRFSSDRSDGRPEFTNPRKNKVSIDNIKKDLDILFEAEVLVEEKRVVEVDSAD